MTSLTFRPSFATFSRICKPLHNGHVRVSPPHAIQSIKVTRRKWRKRMPKNEWCNVFSKVFWDFEKRTFINVHFWFSRFRFEKNVKNLTQTIMVSFAFLSWKICYDNFLTKFANWLKKKCPYTLGNKWKQKSRSKSR